MKAKKMVKRHDEAVARTKAVVEAGFYPHEGFRRDRIALEYHLLRAKGVAEFMDADSEDLCTMIGMALIEAENLTVSDDG